MKAAKLSSCEEYQKYVGILIDEMHIREEMIHSKHKGCLSGFANLGNINEQLLKFEKSLNDTGTESTCTDQADNVAKTMMVFMVKGLFTSLAFPYAFFHVPMYQMTCCTSPCGIASLGLNGVVLRYYLLLLMVPQQINFYLRYMIHLNYFFTR